MKIGYVRVSTKEQNTARQEELMKSLGVDKIYIDRLSGKNTDRPALLEMLGFVREGDSVIVESISRFARNTKDLLELTEQLNNKRVQFIFKKRISTRTLRLGSSCLQYSEQLQSWSGNTYGNGRERGLRLRKRKGNIKDDQRNNWIHLMKSIINGNLEILRLLWRVSKWKSAVVLSTVK